VVYGEFFSFESGVRNGERWTYLVYDFNGRLKDLSPLCCIVIILNVESRIGHVM
jgi:hypothetical protein